MLGIDLINHRFSEPAAYTKAQSVFLASLSAGRATQRWDCRRHAEQRHADRHETQQALACTIAAADSTALLKRMAIERRKWPPILLCRFGTWS